MEGIELQHPTGYVCGVCGGTAIVNVDDGRHYLCATHAMEPVVAIDLTEDEVHDPIAAAPTPAAFSAVKVGAGRPAQAATIRDPDVQDLLTDVVNGLRAIRHRLESAPGS